MNGNPINYEFINEFLEELDVDENILALADATSSMVNLIRGTLDTGQKFYAYLAVKPSRYVDFLKAQQAGSYNMEDYGEILCSDFLPEPPEEVIRAMEELYGVQHDYQEKMVTALEEAAKEINQQEQMTISSLSISDTETEAEKRARILAKFGIKT